MTSYSVLHKAFNPNECLKYVTNNTVNYPAIKGLIDQSLLATATQDLPGVDKPMYRRFTFYHNRYPSLSSVYHKTLYNYLDKPSQLPIYCALCFMDSGTVEVIDGSHDTTNSWTLGGRNQLQLEKGDILIVNASLIVRDMNTTGHTTRILKIWDIFANRQTYQQYADKMVVVQTAKSLVMQSLAAGLVYTSQYSIFITPINIVNYLLVYYGIQYHFLLEDIPLTNRRNKIIGYDTSPNAGTNQWNRTIVCDSTLKTKVIGNRFISACVLAGVLIVIGFYSMGSNKHAKLKEMANQFVIKL